MSLDTLKTTCLTVIALAAFAPHSASALLIDDFSTDQAEITATPSGPSSAFSTANGGGIVGGSRDLHLSTTPDPQGLDFVRARVVGGLARLSTDGPDDVDLLFQWDGADGNPNSLDAFGLGGVDFTDAGDSNSLELGLAFNDNNVSSIFVEVFSMDGGSSTFNIPGFPVGGMVPGTFSIFLLFDAFSGDADFTNVGAIEITVSDLIDPGLDFQLDFVRTAEAIPLPAAFWLFGSALFGLGFARRRA